MATLILSILMLAITWRLSRLVKGRVFFPLSRKFFLIRGGGTLLGYFTSQLEFRQIDWGGRRKSLSMQSSEILIFQRMYFAMRSRRRWG
ncbi:hypothetical protein ASD22_16100 [Rhodanobacter sp. Root480]|nr:hypothetical protein ASD22_16100 [Rhodanobacter sp. Root480]